jgi:hypothetical protein
MSTKHDDEMSGGLKIFGTYPVDKVPLQGLDAARIHHDLDAVHGPDAIPYSMVTQILRSAIWTHTDS